MPPQTCLWTHTFPSFPLRMESGALWSHGKTSIHLTGPPRQVCGLLAGGGGSEPLRMVVRSRGGWVSGLSNKARLLEPGALGCGPAGACAWS